MRPVTLILAIATLTTALPKLLPLPRREAQDATTLGPPSSSNTTSQKTTRTLHRRKFSDELCDTVADYFNQNVPLNGTMAGASEARKNQEKGYSHDGPVYDGVKGFIPNEEYFEDDPEGLDGPSGIPEGGPKYPH